MADDGKQATQERRILLVLGTLAFIVAVGLIILAFSSFHASSTPSTIKGKPVAHVSSSVVGGWGAASVKKTEIGDALIFPDYKTIASNVIAHVGIEPARHQGCVRTCAGLGLKTNADKSFQNLCLHRSDIAWKG